MDPPHLPITGRHHSLAPEQNAPAFLRSETLARSSSLTSDVGSAESSESGGARAPLLPAQAKRHPAARETRAAAFRHELTKILALALPTSLVGTVSFLASLVGVVQVGRLGTSELSALTLGTTLFNLTGLSWVLGLTGGMDTLCGQVYGAGMYGAVGVLFQRAVLVCLLMGAPSYVLWWFAEEVLVLMGQPRPLAALAAGYVRRAAPCLALSTVKFCCRSYFTSQGVVLPVTFITFTCTMLSPLYNYLFITWLGCGLAGAAWAYLAGEATAVALFSAAMAAHSRWLQPPSRRTWGGWDRAAWRGWGPYLRVALPSTAMSCLDWWVLEVMVLLAGLGDQADVQVAAMGLCFNAFTLVYYTVEGFGEAASTRVSHMLGAGRGCAARRSAAVSLAAGMVTCGGVCAGLMVGGPAAVVVFSRSRAVKRAVRTALPYVIAAAVGYSANTVLAGVLRGAGRQATGLWVNLVTLWVVGLPAAAALALVAGLGNLGLWAGIALMNGLQGSAMGVKVARFNWAREVVRSRSVLSLHASTFGGEDGGGEPLLFPAGASEDGEEPEVGNGDGVAWAESRSPAGKASEAFRTLGGVSSGAGGCGPDTVEGLVGTRAVAHCLTNAEGMEAPKGQEHGVPGGAVVGVEGLKEPGLR